MTTEKRLKLDQLFMRTAYEFQNLSHCVRLKVGAVITKDDRIVSCGYNGTPKGWHNCDDFNCDIEPDDLQTNLENSKRHHLFSEQYEIHAEMNAIIDMAKRGISPIGCTLYTTIAPCKNCAKLVIASGINRIVFDKFYDRDIEQQLKSRADIKTADNDLWNWVYKDLNGIDIINLLTANSPNEIEIIKLS